MHNAWAHLLWVYYPYLMLASFFFGTFIRFKYFHGSITAKSSEIFEKKKLMMGSILFHIGIILAFFGHILGMLVPQAWTDYFGITEHMYHIFGSLMMGIPAGSLAWIGMAILTWRRMTVARVYKTSSINDILVDWVLLITITLGMSCTIYGAFIDFNYRQSIGPWVRSLFTLNPQWQLMLNVPLIYRIHVLVGFFVFGYFPYTRLVHALTLPWQYIFRRFIVYRRRTKLV